MTITYGSVCSGIEAAGVAWHSLGWRALWLAEIEKFPSAVLSHHYPDAPNLGDMTKIAALIRTGTVAAPDVLVGGTPCQAFSIAGLRGSMSDARGKLTLSFVDLANAIDATRIIRGEAAAIIVWENVPGVFSASGNAFGCFLGALAGEDGPVVAPGKKWSNAGCVYGPERIVAWRVMDAQYAGVAQRRRRVFVVASARAGFDPTAVLFEFDGVRRDFAPSRKTGENVTGTISARTSGGGGLGTDFELGGGFSRSADSGVICMAHGQGGAEIACERRTTLTCNHEAPIIAGTLQSNGKAAGSATQQDAESGMLVPCASFAIQAGALRTNPESGPDGVGVQSDIAYTLEARAEVQAIAFDARQDCVSSPNVFGALGSSSPQAQAVCFSSKDHGADAAVEIAPTMRAMNHTASHANGGGQLAVCVTGDITHTLKADGFDASEDGTGRGQPIVAVQLTNSMYNKGFIQENYHGKEIEANAGTLLRRVRQEIGEEAFAKWGLGILDSLQSQEILQRAMHGTDIRKATFSRSWVVCCALGFPVTCSEGAVQSLLEAGCERCASYGSQSFEQFTGQLGAYLSGLSQPGAQAERFMLDLWKASEGIGILQYALSAIQEVRRPSRHQRQPIHRFAEGGRAERDQSVQSSGVRIEISRERVLRETCPAGEARDVVEYSKNSERVHEVDMGKEAYAVRRLTVEECEFLQGFPRGYTQGPYRNKPAADGPRYKAIGNSMAVPCMSFIGQRIAAALKESK